MTAGAARVTPSGPGLGRRAARGAVVTVGGQLTRMCVQLVSVVVLARLLTPEDYGLLAMVTVIVGIGEILRDFGLSSAAVQARELSRQQRDNLLWLNGAIGLVLLAALYLGAGAVAAAFDRTELVGVAQALSISFLLNGLATQYRADLVRRLEFVRLAVVDITASASALVAAVVVALAGGEYWALVTQVLTQAGVLLLGLAVAARWLPRLPRRAPMRGLLTFGWRLMGTQLIGYAGNNVDNLIIGLRFGAGPLGLYNRGFHLLMTPLTQLRAPSTTVALPILSRLQDEPQRYLEFVRRGQLALGYTLVAGLGMVVAAAEPVTAIFLGPAWTEVTPILRLLATAGIFQTLAYVGYWIYLSKGLTADLLRYTLLTSAIKVVCIAVGSLWGVLGVAVGFAVAPAIAWPLSLWWLSRRARIRTGRLFTGALRILAAVAVAVLAATAVDVAAADLPAVARLLLTVVVTVATYGLLALLVRPVRADLAGVLELARLGLRRAAPA